ncbi:phosphatidate cytidylyltransferase [Spiroplasma sp. TIUS-1]|uniref:phosphatidate cytidylyltransferase n=1 Tax=Spiroplasma sp. TIUS-1 TaxID=216963 RepID=UPI0013979BA3|nr:phosphatidate cytidylyltransferase [Spiroplasma sp. TIUS-1]QHX35981.1 phosphatidate cytidylyltransferase [Spiroplasma sp. TIUS-1]
MKSKNNKTSSPIEDSKKTVIKSEELRVDSKVSFGGIKVRLFSAMILVIVLLIYLFSALAYSFFADNITSPSWLDIFASVHLLVSFLIVGAAAFELSRAFGFRKLFQHSTYIFLACIIFYLPITVENSNFPGWIYLSWPNTLAVYIPFIWIMSVLIFVLISIILFLKNENLFFKDVFLFTGYMIIVILGVKGITTIALTPVNTIDFFIAGGQSVATIIWIWIMVIATDTFAYFVGIKWGKNKLAPIISPKKSIEGAIGGWLGAFILGVTYASILIFAIPNNLLFIPFKGYVDTADLWVKILIIIIFSIIIPILSIVGDLLFSFLKRQKNIKDYSNLIPGHGGLLDRLDSILFTTFVMEIIILILK